MTELDGSTKASRPCVVYLNGEYWGLYVLEEDYSDNYFESHYGVNKDDVVVYKPIRAATSLTRANFQREKQTRDISSRSLQISSLLTKTYPHRQIMRSSQSLLTPTV